MPFGWPLDELDAALRSVGDIRNALESSGTAEAYLKGVFLGELHTTLSFLKDLDPLDDDRFPGEIGLCVEQLRLPTEKFLRDTQSKGQQVDKLKWETNGWKAKWCRSVTKQTQALRTKIEEPLARLRQIAVAQENSQNPAEVPLGENRATAKLEDHRLPQFNSDISWFPEPRRDAALGIYCFEGYKIDHSGELRKYTRYLGTHEIGSDGRPLPGLNPSGSHDNFGLSSTPRSEAIRESAHILDVGNPGDTKLDEVNQTPANPVRSLAKEVIHSGSLDLLDTLHQTQGLQTEVQDGADTSKRLTQEDRRRLEEVFTGETQRPSTSLKRRLAEDIGCSVVRVNDWFQNRRAREKKARRSQEDDADVELVLGQAEVDTAEVEANSSKPRRRTSSSKRSKVAEQNARLKERLNKRSDDSSYIETGSSKPPSSFRTPQRGRRMSITGVPKHPYIENFLPGPVVPVPVSPNTTRSIRWPGFHITTPEFSATSAAELDDNRYSPEEHNNSNSDQKHPDNANINYGDITKTIAEMTNEAGAEIAHGPAYPISDGGAELKDTASVSSRATSCSSNKTGGDASYIQYSSDTQGQESTVPTSLLESSLRHEEMRIPDHEHLAQTLKLEVGDHPKEDDKECFTGVGEDCDAENDDIQSLLSIADSIGSTDSNGGSLGQAGVNYIVAKLTGDPDLLGLYTEASQRLTEAQFVRNNRRLLKRFYLDLRHEVYTASQKEAAAFLRSRRRRATISMEVLTAVVPDSEGPQSKEKRRADYSMLNEYLNSIGASERVALGLDDDQEISKADDSDSDHDDDGSDLDHTNEHMSPMDTDSLQATGRFLVGSNAFEEYKKGFRQFLHPNLGTRRGMEESHVREKPNSDAEKKACFSELVEENQRLSEITRKLEDVGKSDRASSVEHSEERQQEIILDGRQPASTRPNSRQIRLSPPHPPSQRSDVDVSKKHDLLATPVSRWIIDVMWPPAKGSQRVWYLCGCGQYTYIDVTETAPGGVEDVRQRILESAAAVRTRASQDHGSSTSFGNETVSVPPRAHFGSSSSQHGSLSDTSLAGAPTLTTLTSSSDPSNSAPRRLMFLLVCVSGQLYKTLPELRYVDVLENEHDEKLLKAILEQYDDVRRGAHWTSLPALVIPKLPASIKQPLNRIGPLLASAWSPVQSSSFVSSLSNWWRAWVPEVDLWAPLYVLDTADFVEFQLIPHPEGKDAYPDLFIPGQWPAADDTRYVYSPVPMKGVASLNLWHFRQRGPHLEYFWYDTVPKKVDGGLFRPPGTRGSVVGYGIRINERLNASLVLRWLLVALILTGASVVIYAVCTRDNSSAFGLGAYLIAVLTVYVSLQYEAWKRA